MRHIIDEIIRLETKLNTLPEGHTHRKYLEDKIYLLELVLQEGQD